MNIGIFGLWGMNITDVSWGGFDTGFSEIACRLVNRDHNVTIYCRKQCYPKNNRPKQHKGVKLIYVPTLNTKTLSFLTSLTTSLLYALIKNKHDIYLFVNVGSGLHCLLAKAFGKKVVINVDGLDWVRGKWGLLAKLYFRLSAKIALNICDSVVTDADAMVDYYLVNYNKNLEMISYGAYIEKSEFPSLIDQFNIKPNEYYLIASRMVLENNPHIIIDAFLKSKTNKKLLVAGAANYDSSFHQKLMNQDKDKIIFTGWINDQKVIKELHCNCYAYIHGHSVGGTNPALLKALGFGNMILALNTPFNSEVLKDETYGLLWEKNASHLCKLINQIEENEKIVIDYKIKSQNRIKEKYTWDRVTNSYELLFKRIN